MLVVPRDENIEEEGDEEIIPAIEEALLNAEANCIGNTCTLPATQHLQLRVIGIQNQNGRELSKICLFYRHIVYFLIL